MSHQIDALAAFSQNFAAVSDAYREARTATGTAFPPDGNYTVMLKKIDIEVGTFNTTDAKDGPTVPSLNITPHYLIPDHADPAVSGMEFQHPTMRIVAVDAAAFKKLPDNKQMTIRISLEQLKGYYKYVTGGQEPTGSPQADLKTLLDMIAAADAQNTAIQLDVTCKTVKSKGKGKNADREYTNRNVYVNRLVQGVQAPSA